MSTAMSRRMILRTAAAAAGGTLVGAYGLGPAAVRAEAATVAARARASATKGGRVGATVGPSAYPAPTTWDQAMANFNTDVGRTFAVAKRYFTDVSTWPTETNIGVKIQSLIDRRCRGLLCFKPALDGSDLPALLASLKAIKHAGLTDAKITLYQEQGLGDTPRVTAAQFKQAYVRYQPVRQYFPLFVDFSGSNPATWAEYRPAGVDGIAVDLYANAWVKGSRIDVLAQWADESGQELGVWEMGNTASAALPTKDQVQRYFDYLTKLQGDRLSNHHQVGDMAWFNGPHNGSYLNTISGTTVSPLSTTDRAQLDAFFDTFDTTT